MTQQNDIPKRTERQDNGLILVQQTLPYILQALSVQW